MWAPGAYKNDGFRTTAPAPNIGIEKYFFEAGEKILTRIKDSRGTVILPERTGPIADVLYSRRRQLGRRRVVPQGHHRLLVRDRRGPHPQHDDGHDADASSASSRASARSAPAAARAPARPAARSSTRAATRRWSSPPATTASSSPPTTTRMDTTPPSTSLDSDGVTQSKDPINYRFNWDDEAAVIHYTTDGSTPTLVVADVQQPARAQRRRGPDDHHAGREHGQVVRGRHQGQPVSAVQSKTFLVGLTDTPGTVGWHRAGDAVADAGRSGDASAPSPRASPRSTRRPRRRP